ncbi:nitrate/nitrite-specific signal transduction histidine kinase [Pedobacter sp. CAN_A7]|uniref:hypothetical protein n=1 Tax=Pedobacter sp. CAN_A7 TaxID=2787722 RepID=UPI0018CB84F7
MYRIIFHNLTAGYQVFDASDEEEISRERAAPHWQDFKVICLVSYNRRSYVYKCEDFDQYADDVDDLVFACEHYTETEVLIAKLV